MAIGLALFAEASNEMTRSFGLNLLRDYLSSRHPTNVDPQMDFQNRHLVRKTVSDWLVTVIGAGQSIPQHTKNNMLSIYTLCIKRDYPEVWSNAFTELLLFGRQYGFVGVDVVIRIMNELEIEVVVFNENRNKEEIQHNTLIKDTMRNSNVVREVVQFLCQATNEAIRLLEHQDIAGRCLLCLAEMIGWIDINLVLTEALPTIYSMLQPTVLHAAQVGALTCIYEIVKKGMDPVLKVDLLQKIDLIPRLLVIKTDFTSTQSMLDDPDNSIYQVHKQYGLLLDMIVLELLGCWNKFEDALFPSPSPKTSFMSANRVESFGSQTDLSTIGDKQLSSPNPNAHVTSGVAELMQMSPTTSSLLHLIVPEVINFLRHPYTTLAICVVPAVNKLIQLLKLQKFRMDAIFDFMKTRESEQHYFLAYKYLESILYAIAHQCQFPMNFRFEDIEPDEEEENEIIEVSLVVRSISSLVVPSNSTLHALLFATGRDACLLSAFYQQVQTVKSLCLC